MELFGKTETPLFLFFAVISFFFFLQMLVPLFSCSSLCIVIGPIDLPHWTNFQNQFSLIIIRSFLFSSFIWPNILTQLFLYSRYLILPISNVSLSRLTLC